MNTIIESIKRSASIDLIARAKALKEAGYDVIGLAGGEPDFDTPEQIKDKAIRELNNGNTHYSIGKGLLSLRKKISEKLMEDNGIRLSADEIIVTPGAKMAIYLAVRSVINQGDEVLILTPSWVSYSEIVKASLGIPVEVPLNPEDGYKIRKEILEAYTTEKTRMVILCSPNNPTGRMLSLDEIGEIQEYLSGKDVVLLSDEIYEKISYKEKPLSPASFEELKEKTITVNGFSKAYAMTGWRLGYLACSKKYIGTIERLFTHTVTGTPPFIQEAATVAIDCKCEVETMRKEFLRRRDYFISELRAIKGIEVINPEGAFYAWCKFSIEGDVAQRLLDEAGVVGVPGLAYGSEFEKYVRFSFACSYEQLTEAVGRIKSFMREAFYEIE